MCSINSTGVVFVNTVPIEVSSELTLTVQTSLLGVTHDWTVHGWVVECSPVQDDGAVRHQVTLLFSDLPAGLKHVLALAEQGGSCPYPRVPGFPVLGQN